MDMKIKLLVIATLIFEVNSSWKIKLDNPHPAFDPNIYEKILNPKECEQQLAYISKKNFLLALKFIDAGANIPRNILGLNMIDLGNYYQCLSIDHKIQDMEIKGKYCSIKVNVEVSVHQRGNTQNATLPNNEVNIYSKLLKEGVEGMQFLKRYNTKIDSFDLKEFIKKYSSSYDNSTGPVLPIELGICIPKVCSTHQALNSTLFNNSRSFKYIEKFCRIPNDKPWSPADTAATITFSIIGLLTVICTVYDVTQRFVLKKDVSKINIYLQTFSAYTSGCRLVNFTSGPNTIHCLDGIRVLATAWVVLGHITFTQIKTLNISDMIKWSRSLESIYAIAAPLTVDTFFTIGGILIVYTKCGKISGKKFLKNIPQFYLHRFLRIFPLFATTVLLQASFFHRISDGPMWKTVAKKTDYCRTHWWITLLYLQNFINDHKPCLGHTWYLAIDMHLYIVSPLVLFWVFKGKKTAWLALTGSLLAVLIAATFYNFKINLPAHIIAPFKLIDASTKYMTYYYTNMLTRASPFFVGMLTGYTLYIYKEKQAILSWTLVTLFWFLSAVILNMVFFSIHFVTQEDWDHDIINNILNSFMRPAWGLAIGWIVFACANGYGGPINWFLSLKMWRLPVRLCYGVYLFHYPILFIVCDSVISPVYFSAPRFMFMFSAYISISFLVSYFATILIDIPFATITTWMFKMQQRKTVVKL